MATCLIVTLALGLSYLLTAGLFWMFCWLVPMLGFAPPFAFTWGNALIVWILIGVIRTAFGLLN